MSSLLVMLATKKVRSTSYSFYPGVRALLSGEGPATFEDIA